MVQCGITQNAGPKTAVTSHDTYTATVYLSPHESPIVAMRSALVRGAAQEGSVTGPLA